MDIIELEHLPSIERLKHAALELPQVELPTEHYFADGMYCRRLARAAGVLIVGKVHKREHFYIIAAGRVRVWCETDGARDYKAGDVIVSAPGSRRATYAIEDSVSITVHRTSETDIERIEQELVEPDSESAFDAFNRIRITQK